MSGISTLPAAYGNLNLMGGNGMSGGGSGSNPTSSPDWAPGPLTQSKSAASGDGKHEEHFVVHNCVSRNVYVTLGVVSRLYHHRRGKHSHELTTAK